MAQKLESLISREQDPFTTQDVLLEVVNGIRFRTFENILRQSLDSIDVKKAGEDKEVVREEVRNKLGNWYMVRHGVDSKGNQHEMVTLIQVCVVTYYYQVYFWYSLWLLLIIRRTGILQAVV